MKKLIRKNRGFLAFLLLLGLFRTAVADWNPIPSGSMRPNLLEGDVVFVNLPAEGGTVTAGEAFGDVESVKAVSDLVSPVTGTVCAVNEELLDSPELVNSDPYGAWLIKVENVEDSEELLDAAAYETFCTEEG